MGNALRKIRNETTMLAVSEVKNEAVRKLLDKLPPAIRDNYQLSKDQVNQLALQMRNMSHGALCKTALRCKGESCPMKDDCLFLAQKIPPIGYACPYEMAFIELMQEQLIRELNIEPDNLIELHMLGELIQAELYAMRAAQDVAKNGFLVEQPVALSQTGETIMRHEESITFQISEKIQRRKERIRSQFLVTREAKAKYLKIKPDTPDTHSADLVDKFKVIVEEND